MFLKIVGLGLFLGKKSYLRDPWNYLDMFIVVVSWATFNNYDINISAIKTFRMIKPLKALSNIRQMRILLKSIFSSIALLRDLIVILFFIFLIFGITGL